MHFVKEIGKFKILKGMNLFCFGANGDPLPLPLKLPFFGWEEGEKDRFD
jgi:hypothetical protein